MVAALCCHQVYAQNSEYKSFVSSSQECSMLFRGRKATSYNFIYNGHCYWEKPEFVRGDIFYNGKQYHDVLFNIDACSDDLLVKYANGMVAVSIDWHFVTRIESGEAVFVYLPAWKKKLKEGLYEELLSGEVSIYRKVTKTVCNDTGSHNGDGIGYDDPDYKFTVTTYFKNTVRFYLRNSDGSFKKIGRNKALKYVRYGRV